MSPFKEYNRIRKENHEIAYEHCENTNSRYTIVHEAIVCIRSMKEAVGKNNDNGKAGLKQAGYVPWNPLKAETAEGLQFDPEEQAKAENVSPYDQTQKQKIRKYLRIGGLITSDDFIEAVK